MNFKITLLAATALATVARAHAGDDNTASIAEAVKQLDPKNDNHWTADGLPRIDTLKTLTGDQSVSRESVEKAAPNFNREVAGGENRTGNGTPETSTPTPTPAPAPAATPSAPADPMAAATADGWAKHPDAEGYHYKGDQVKTDAEVAAMYDGSQGAQSAPSGGNQTASEPSDPAQDLAADISGQTGMGGAMTARSPEPVEGELRKTHVSEPSQGEPGEKPIGVTKGMTGQGVNTLGTPEGTVENPARATELSGEVAARNAGSVLTPAQAPAEASNAEGISLGGAADPVVEARAPGGAVIAEGAREAEFLEGETAGGPFGSSGITAGDGTGKAQLNSVDADFDGDPDEVEALEAQLEDQAHKSAQLRAKVDEVSAELHTSLRTEAQLRRQIEANRPRSGNMTTIQTFLRTSQERRARQVREEREARNPRK